jgi:cytochrome b6-f complex iron-sulfur subunit
MANATTDDTNATPKKADDALKPQKPKPRLQSKDEDEKAIDASRLKRRELVWHMTAGFITANLLSLMYFFFPRTLFEPKTKFKIGYPTDYGLGVDTKLQASRRIWVVKNPEGLFVIYAKCTHLGCTPDWKGTENKFKCPCHGSGFTSEGINFEGPAPRPLDRCYVELDPEGQIVVDTLRVFRVDDFAKPGAMLRGV